MASVMSTTPADRQLLLRIARGSIEAHVSRVPSPSIPLEGAAARPGGAFVTLHHRGDLRGCIGHIEADSPVGRIVARCAVAAASTDPRFPPVDGAELAAITIELSLLGALERVSGVEHIEIGRHGLVVELGWNRGLLLPQVATERGWNAERFVAETCRKAGLAHNAWRAGAAMFVFEAEVFGEERNGQEGDDRPEARS